ncbi:MAG: hypothetical protein ACI9CF_000632 [Candidatus Omnitrophota bacterium]|jgi:hypothetical protein
MHRLTMKQAYTRHPKRVRHPEKGRHPEAELINYLLQREDLPEPAQQDPCAAMTSLAL